ncbi:hypothetical protein VNI00_000505 [Paramarasmius palmivorus]|uniref:Uncharacterized protein n=1 Tax=Paramarasmius palmivorus TaxID=297713 RepID=A0AAW0E870_9AGAR
MSSKKSESTTSLISKDSKSSSFSSRLSLSKGGANSSASLPKSDSDFAKKAKANGWGAPTPTQPRLGQM